MEALTIQAERPTDFERVFTLVQLAFLNQPYSDQDEHFLVERLRKSPSFVPELSLVAESEGVILGHILLTKVTVGEGTTARTGLILAPIAVFPAWQNRGIGGQLIRAAHERAAALGFDFVVLTGHGDYYPRFGYERASQHGISFAFEVDDANAMVKELRPGGLDGVAGEVVLDPVFFEDI